MDHGILADKASECKALDQHRTWTILGINLTEFISNVEVPIQAATTQIEGERHNSQLI